MSLSHCYHRPGSNLQDLQQLIVTGKGEVFAAYAVVKFKDGSDHFEVMTKSQIDAIRKRSKATGESSPWNTDYDWMSKKTAIKQALKTVPKSPDKPALVQALAHDRAVDLGEAFNSDLADAIDVVGEEVSQITNPPGSRTEALASKLGADPVVPPHDKDS